MKSEVTFPLLCEKCLGENPYLKMQRTPDGGTCKMCAKGFELFRWRPGRGESFRKTEVKSLKIGCGQRKYLLLNEISIDMMAQL